jgi:RNA polymerase sigma-70 factor (ECF subfamily)
MQVPQAGKLAAPRKNRRRPQIVIHRFIGKSTDTSAVGGDNFATDLLGAMPRLRRYAMALVGDRSLADDLVQDSVERALKSRATLKDPRRLFGWLRTILHNLYMDALRERRGRGTTVDLDEMANSLNLSVAPNDRTATIDFLRAMDDLSVDHRQILLLIGIEGLSYRDIAAELDIPMGTVMSRLARARDQLRSKLESSETTSSRSGYVSAMAE